MAARDECRAADYAKLHDIPRVHSSYEALIADPEIDLVYISTPPACHAEQALLAIAAGKPVLVEKPFAMSAPEARRVHDQAQGSGVPVFEAMHSLHHALFGRLLALIGEGAIGDLRHLTAEFNVPIDDRQGEFRWNAQLGGGALMDLGVYPRAWCRRLLGQSFTVESADADFRRGVDAAFSARLRFAGSVTAEVKSSMADTNRAASLLIEGTSGTLQVSNPVAPQLGHELRLRTEAGETAEIVEGPSTFEAQLIALRDTLVDGAAFPLPADDFVRSMEAIDAVRSAWERPAR
jgi:predicted dehydrogenase